MMYTSRSIDSDVPKDLYDFKQMKLNLPELDSLEQGTPRNQRFDTPRK